MLQKSTLIIGSSTGIRLALAKQYQTLGYNIIATCRKPSLDLKNISSNILENLDLLSP